MILLFFLQTWHTMQEKEIETQKCLKFFFCNYSKIITIFIFIIP